MGESQAQTPGGTQLRRLRERTGRTQLAVELEAELGTGYLQRVESGRVAQPSRATVERILAALGARYGERREVLQLFGYTVPTPLPTADEIRWACEVSERELREFPFPAYVLDCGHRLLAWNRQVPRLLGLDGDAALPEGLAGRSILAAWFDPASPLAGLVAEPERFLPAVLRALRYEIQQVGHEPWYEALLGRLQALPPFRHHWTAVEREPAALSAARAQVALGVAVPGVGLLQFRLSAEPFTRDPRFRLIHFFPADTATMRQCSAWVDVPAPRPDVSSSPSATAT